MYGYSAYIYTSGYVIVEFLHTEDMKLQCFFCIGKGFFHCLGIMRYILLLVQVWSMRCCKREDIVSLALARSSGNKQS